MFCPNCGTDAGNAKFCPSCGANLSQAAAGTVSSPQSASNQNSLHPMQPVPPQANKKKKSCLVVLCLFLFVFVAFVAIVAFSAQTFMDSATSEKNKYANIDAIQATSEKCGQVADFVTAYLTEQGYTVTNQSAEWIGYYKYIGIYDFEEYENMALGGYYSYIGDITTGEIATANVTTYWNEEEQPVIVNLSVSDGENKVELVEYSDQKMADCWTAYNEHAETAPEAESTAALGKSETQLLPNLEIIDSDSKVDGYLRYVTGHIRNNTNRTYSYVQVSVNLYNGETLIGSTLDNVNNLGPGQVWEFNALIYDDSANKYQIVDVSGF